jgi:hypothetical protein
MFQSHKLIRWALAAVIAATMLSGCGFRRKKYENPIGKDTEQPDKVLFDKAIRDIEKGRYEVARLTLNTLQNTYDTSEFMAKANSPSPIAGCANMAPRARPGRRRIRLHPHPTMEESAEAREARNIHYRQMEKPDRDVNHAMRANDECSNPPAVPNEVCAARRADSPQYSGSAAEGEPAWALTTRRAASRRRQPPRDDGQQLPLQPGRLRTLAHRRELRQIKAPVQGPLRLVLSAPGAIIH